MCIYLYICALFSKLNHLPKIFDQLLCAGLWDGVVSKWARSLSWITSRGKHLLCAVVGTEDRRVDKVGFLTRKMDPGSLLERDLEEWTLIM